jgi:hypothetical protein
MVARPQVVHPDSQLPPREIYLASIDAAKRAATTERLACYARDLLAALKVAAELLERNGIQRADIDAVIAQAEAHS